MVTAIKPLLRILSGFKLNVMSTERAVSLSKSTLYVLMFEFSEGWFHSQLREFIILNSFLTRSN